MRASSLTVAAISFLTAVSVPAHADDRARISRLESEIQLLRSQIDAQNRRIQALEAGLSKRTGTARPAPAQPRVVDEAHDAPAAQSGPQPWHAAAAWVRITKGMTAEEVISILGPPTAAESVSALKTLFYRGSSPAGAPLSGMVNLRDERVVAVVQPAF